MIKIAQGILNWDGVERRSNRYGRIVVGDFNFNSDAKVTPFVDRDRLTVFEAEKVRLVCRVVEARESGHIGDLALDIVPTMPMVGEEIELGVGRLRVCTSSWDDALTALELAPDDGRAELWIDPRLLYRLHDQTVDFLMELTTDPCHEAPELGAVEEGVIGCGEADGSFQTKYIEPGELDRLDSRVDRLGDGLIMVSPPDLSKGARPGYVKKGHSDH